MTQSQSLHPTPTLRLINFCEPLLKSVDVNADKILAEVEDKTGLIDQLPPRVTNALRVLCRSIQEDSDLHYFGRLRIHSLLTHAIETRVRFEKLLIDKPQISAVSLRAPLVVTGLFRSGTTYLHRLLSVAPDTYAPPFWRLLNPLVDSGSLLSGRTDAKLKLAMFRLTASKDIDAMHLVRADLPEECVVALRLDLHSLMLWRSVPAMAYNRWLLQQDLGPTYAMYSQLLRYYQTSIGEQRFALKAPMHLLGLDALLDHLPNAMIVQTHREPTECLPSDHKLTAAFHQGVSKSINTSKVIERTTETAKTMAERSVSFAESARASHVCHIAYTNLITKPVETVAHIYDYFSLEFSPSLEKALTQYVSQNPQHKHGKNSYSLEDYGQTHHGVNKMFSQYRERFLKQ